MSHTFAEAIAVARDAFVQIGSPAPFVRVDPILRYAERVASQENGRPHTIVVETTDWKVSEARGTWRRGKDTSTIYVSDELNTCWRRFVICKEAIHMMVDDKPATYATSIDSQVLEAFQMRWPTQKSAPLSSELLAVVVTFELLYSWPHRARRSNPPTIMYSEAKKFMIPEMYLDAYFRLPFGQASEELNDDLATVGQ